MSATHEFNFEAPDGKLYSSDACLHKIIGLLPHTSNHPEVLEEVAVGIGFAWERKRVGAACGGQAPEFQFSSADDYFNP